jgi:hypothetical protein
LAASSFVLLFDHQLATEEFAGPADRPAPRMAARTFAYRVPPIPWRHSF